jgi:hypothetical protein
MEAHLCGFFIGASLLCHPHTPYPKPITSEAQEAKHAGGQQPSPTSRAPRTPSNSAPPGTHKDHPNAATTRDFGAKQQKRRRHHQNALRRFLVMLAKIGRNYAPNFNNAHPQGVQLDSLGSLKSFD